MAIKGAHTDLKRNKIAKRLKIKFNLFGLSGFKN